METGRAIALHVNGGNGSFSWRLTAQTLNVNQSSAKFLEFRRPTDPSRELGRVAEDPRHEEEEGFGPSVASSTAEGTQASFMILNRSLNPIFLAGSAAYAALHAVENNVWVIGGTTPGAPRAEFVLPAGVPQADTQVGQFSMRGNFSLLIWESNVSVHASGKDRSYHAGNTSKPIGPSGPGGEAYAKERTYNLLRLDAFDGVISVSTIRKFAAVVSEGLGLAGLMTAQFDGVSGTFPAPNRSLGNGSFEIAGRFEANSTRSGKGPSFLSAQLRSVAIDPPTAGTSAVEPSDSDRASVHRKPMPEMVGAILTLAAAGFFVVVRYRGRSVTIDDLEVAVLSNQIAKARRLGRRLVRRGPPDGNALFLYGAALLAAGRFDEILRLEPLAKQLPQESRVGVALILAAASKAHEDPAREQYWRREAAGHPGLELLLERGRAAEPREAGDVLRDVSAYA